jgi:hypothetical protein
MCATCISDLNYRCYSLPRAIPYSLLPSAYLFLRLPAALSASRVAGRTIWRTSLGLHYPPCNVWVLNGAKIQTGRTLVAGRVIDSSLEISSLFSILVGEQEDSGLLSKARAYLGLVFHLNRDFPPDFGRKTPEKKPKNTNFQKSNERFYYF